MLSFPTWKITLVLGLVLLGALFSLPNFLGGRALPGFMPSATMNLGLDLRGGSYLLLEVDPDELKTNRLRELSSEIAKSLTRRPGNVRFRNRQVVGDAVRLRIVEPSQIDEARDRIEDLATPVGNVGGPSSLEIREAGGVLTVSFSDAQLEQLEREALSDSIEVVRRRIDGSGTTDPNNQRQGANRIVLEVPGVDDPTQLIDIITRAGVMTLNLVDDEADLSVYPLDTPRLGKVKRAGVTELEPEAVIFEDPILTGGDFATASQGFDERNLPQINFTLKGAGAREFGKFTSENVGRSFAIVLDDKIISAPRVQTPILSGSGRITGTFSLQEAEAIAVVLRAGELPAKLKVVEQRVVGAGLGEDSIRAGATASILGLILVAVFMLFAYGLIGSFAVVSLGANILMIVGVLSGLGATLTLPGIA
ncbi:MAG: protein translocase subunit SecD, partial [Pseudomonadota bacterium]